MSSEAQQPILFCFAGPSGCGKSSICRLLVEDDRSLLLSLSTTTRKPRAGEVDGRDYFFVSEADFRKGVEDGRFFEHAVYAGNLYGTSFDNWERAKANSADLLFDVDVQGVSALKSSFGKYVVCIFVFAPSWTVLEQRLRARNTDSEETITRRLERAQQEFEILSEPGFSQFMILNDNLDDSVENAKAIIRAERLRVERLLGRIA